MAALVQVQRMLASTDASPSELMDRAPELALAVVAASGSIFELLDGEDVTVPSGSAGGAPGIGGRRPLKGSLTGEAIRLDRTLCCDDTELDARVDVQSCRKHGLRSILVTVVRDRTGPLGVLKVFDYRPGHFVPADADSREAEIVGVGRETSGRHASGEPIALDVAISDYRIRGQRLWTAIVRDIGERVRIMADLEQARLGAEEASRAKSAFVATMSQEIRTR